MPWTIEVEERDHIVRVVSDGPMRLVTITQASAEAIASAPPGKTRKFLADERRMLPQLSTLEVFDLPGVLEDLGLRKGVLRPALYRPG